MKKTIYFTIALFFTYSVHSNAHQADGVQKQRSNNRTTAGCGNPQSKVDLDLAGVRATILTGGDMWWDLVSNAGYEVPKGSGRYSIFAGDLWIGGYDGNNQLHLAGQTYRQTGNDWWPGPLDTTNGTIAAGTCIKYDKIWKVNRTEVKGFVNHQQAATADMIAWPGNGDASLHQAHFLAPFTDVDGDGIYNPSAGDYPAFDVSSNTYSICDKRKLPGDQVLWWVFNDMGNIHTESKGAQIGLEIQAEAYAILNGDTDVQQTTFYRYKIINRGNITLGKTYIGLFVGAQIGYGKDDYVGCDVNRGLGYCYNGVPLDKGNGMGYNDMPGAEGSFPPPAVGADLLEGPLADPNGQDDAKSADSTRSGRGYGDGIVDNERLGMATYIYFNNTQSGTQGDPQANPKEYYQYLTATWRDGRRMTYGREGLNAGSSDYTNWMFSDTTDLKNGRTPWTEAIAGNTPDNRRFVLSTGPLTLLPGAVQYLTYAVPWARARTGNNLSSIALLKTVDDKIQALFDNCSVTTVSGIAEASFQKGYTSVFPNPFSLQTQLYVQGKSAVTVRMMDLTGKCVRVYYNVSPGYLNIERGDLKNGMYLYVLENGNNIMAQGKMVIE